MAGLGTSRNLSPRLRGLDVLRAYPYPQASFPSRCSKRCDGCGDEEPQGSDRLHGLSSWIPPAFGPARVRVSISL